MCNGTHAGAFFPEGRPRFPPEESLPSLNAMGHRVPAPPIDQTIEESPNTSSSQCQLIPRKTGAPPHEEAPFTITNKSGVAKREQIALCRHRPHLDASTYSTVVPCIMHRSPKRALPPTSPPA